MGCGCLCRGKKAYEQRGRTATLERGDLMQMPIKTLRRRVRELKGLPVAEVEALPYRSLADCVLMHNILSRLKSGVKSEQAAALKVLRNKDVRISHDALREGLAAIGVPTEETNDLGRRQAAKLLHRRLFENALQASCGFLAKSQRLLLQAVFRQWYAELPDSQQCRPIVREGEVAIKIPALDTAAWDTEELEGHVALVKEPSLALEPKPSPIGASYFGIGEPSSPRQALFPEVSGQVKLGEFANPRRRKVGDPQIPTAVAQAEALASLESLLQGDPIGNKMCLAPPQKQSKRVKIRFAEEDPTDKISTSTRSTSIPLTPACHGVSAAERERKTVDSRVSARDRKFNHMDAELAVCLEDHGDVVCEFDAKAISAHNKNKK